MTKPFLPKSSHRAAFTLAAAAALLPPSARAQCPATPSAGEFQKQTLSAPGQLQEPLELSVAKDGKVFVVERFGRILVYDPQSNQTTEAAKLDVYSHTGSYDMGGALGIAAAPDFPTDNWVYVFWTPRSTFTGTDAKLAKGRYVLRLSRFRFAAGKLDLPTEQILLTVPAHTETHNGGSLRFGKGGDLYLSIGDNNSPACDNNAQYSPMDERPGQEFCDDQATTANTNDLRGKVLRIRPSATQVDGKWYTIPAGNLKEKYASLWQAADLAKVRPEIYTMGHRNPYRIYPHPVTGRLFIAEFGPAAGADSERGPAGADEMSITDEPAFLGYPYFLKDNQAYCHWDFGQGRCVAIQGQAGLKYDPARPVNHSPNNTGVNLLPPAKSASLWEHDGGNLDPIAGLKSCGHGAGPVYHFDSTSASKTKFPPFFHGKWILFGIYPKGPMQPKLAAVPAAQHSRIQSLSDLPFNANYSPGLHDMEFGPDGALYAVDYGTAMYNRNGDAALTRVVYNGCLPPVSTRLPDSRAASARLALAPGQELLAPEGARAVEVYDLAGQRVFASDLAGASRVRLPEGLARGLFRVRWR